jgi:transaldolase
MTRPKMKIPVDGGDPQETRRVKELLGYVDGQTTNPSLIPKNPHIKELIASGSTSSGATARQKENPRGALHS